MANVSNTIALAVASIFLAAIVGYVIWRGLAAVRRVGTFFLLFTVGMAFYGGSKGFWRSVNFPRTDLDVAYLTDNDSRVWSTNFVHLAFTPASMVPQDAQIYLDYRAAASTNDEDWVTYTNATLAAFPNPLDFEFANATNYSWMCYTTWTPGAAEVTNGVVRIGWLLPMDGRTNAIVMLRTGVRYKSPLPYEAEVEWLQSDGNAYINGNLPRPIADASWGSLKFSLPLGNLGTDQRLFALVDNSRNRIFSFGNGWRGEYYYVAGGISCVPNYDYNKWRVSDLSRETTHTMQFSRGALLLDGMVAYGLEGGWEEKNVSNATRFEIFRNSNGAATTSPHRFEGFDISDANGRALGIIPVRVGNVGYIYDRVSGQLFGNAGTGAFVLGPDKTN